MKIAESETNKKWVDFLNRQIDIEIEKPEKEQSMEFIDECNSLLDEVCEEADAPAPKTKEQKLTELYAAFEKQVADKRKRRLSYIWNKIVAAVCVVLVVIITPVFVVAAVNQISPIAVLEKWGHDIFDLPYDTQTKEAGMTFVRLSDVTHYDSLEKLLETEKLNILYPTWIPDGVILVEILEVSTPEGKSLVFKYSGAEIYYEVALYDEYSDMINNDFTDDIVQINGINYYFSINDGTINAIFVNNGYSYSITANDRDTLINLLEGIK